MNYKLFLIFILIILLINISSCDKFDILDKQNVIIVNDEQYYYLNFLKSHDSKEYNIIKIPIYN